MSTITLPLTQLRDILTNWDTSAALNAARFHEARQTYSYHDRLAPRRIVPVDLARALQSTDPKGEVFYIQIKMIPHDMLDQWTPTVEYGVVWPTYDWPRSIEYRITSSEVWLAHRAEAMSRIREEDRITRMAKGATKLFPGVLDHFIETLRCQRSEEDLKAILLPIENALNTKIYEDPQASAPSMASPQSYAPTPIQDPPQDGP